MDKIAEFARLDDQMTGDGDGLGASIFIDQVYDISELDG
jgi:hypothetical protein